MPEEQDVSTAHQDSEDFPPGLVWKVYDSGVLMPISIRTLLAVAAVLSAFNGLVLLAFCLTRKTYPGFLEWTLVNGAMALAYALLSLQETLPGAARTVAANAFVAVAAVLLLDGVSRFVREKRASVAWWLIPALALILDAVFYFSNNAAAAPAIVHAAAVVLPAVVAAVLLCRFAPRRGGALHFATAGLIGFIMAAFAARVAIVALRSETAAWSPALLNLGFFCLILVVQVAVTVAFLLLNAERVEWELRDTLAHVRVLRGMLPICASCKKVRDDQGYWQQLESYVADHSDAEFSHGICPECAERLYPEVAGHTTRDGKVGATQGSE